MTVWTNGCFDVIHRGHVELFKYAKGLSNVNPHPARLVVGIDSDEKVREDKGRGRPYNKLEDRIEVLKSIRYIDLVIPFNSTEGLREAIRKIKPEVMVIGSDWRGKDVIGQEYAGSLEFFDRIGNYSTTKILERK